MGTRALAGAGPIAMKPLLSSLLLALPSAVAVFAPAGAFASEILEVAPLTDRIVLVHFKDGSVVHHKRGEPRSAESVAGVPLDAEAASRPGSYGIQSGGDAAYAKPLAPTSVGRKSKGTDFAWIIDRWMGDHAENDRIDHVKEHWVYLSLPSPMARGKRYAVTTGALATNGRTWAFVFDERKGRSEAVHVNTLGYAPGAPAKFAYLYQWAGDKGGLDLKGYAGKRFWIVDQASGRDVFEGRVAFRKGAKNAETQRVEDTPDGNFLGADVYECDFSAFATPGRYRVAVEGVGGSWPFRIDADVYREAFVTMARGLYHNRSGIALTRPYTEFVRPAPHNPALTPGFRGKLVYSSLRSLDYGSESGTKALIEPTIRGPIESCGWYQDAGDWDSYETHLRVAQELLLAYELNPRAFSDGELSIPESGNGVPDILDEAAWLPRFCQRLRAELVAKGYGSGGIGLRVSGDAFGSDTKAGDVGQGSWEDVNRLWVVSGEDPVATYRYAGAAAGLAHALALAGTKDPKGVDWAREAREAYAWAASHTLAGDEAAREANGLRRNRLYAAASLFRLTGEKGYEARVREDAAGIGAGTALWFEDLYGPAAYAMAGGKADAGRDPQLLARLREAIVGTADAAHASAERRALRWGGDWGFPMLIGQQTTPLVMEMAVGRSLVAGSDPARARAYTADLYTTCDYFLGTNATNGTWITGLGPRHPNFPFHMDAWYNGRTDASGRWTPHPGIIPYSPWRKENAQGKGPWDHDWGNKTTYPAVDAWPGNERYFDNRCSPMGGEFTIHQNTAPAAAIFGVLCAARR